MSKVSKILKIYKPKLRLSYEGQAARLILAVQWVLFVLSFLTLLAFILVNSLRTLIGKSEKDFTIFISLLLVFMIIFLVENAYLTYGIYMDEEFPETAWFIITILMNTVLVVPFGYSVLNYQTSFAFFIFNGLIFGYRMWTLKKVRIFQEKEVQMLEKLLSKLIPNQKFQGDEIKTKCSTSIHDSKNGIDSV